MGRKYLGKYWTESDNPNVALHELEDAARAVSSRFEFYIPTQAKVEAVEGICYHSCQGRHSRLTSWCMRYLVRLKKAERSLFDKARVRCPSCLLEFPEV